MDRVSHNKYAVRFARAQYENETQPGQEHVKKTNNKRALLTAAGQGIGRATAIAMVREGAHVFATDINGETLADLQREAEGLGTIETFTLDVTDNDAVVGGRPCAARYSFQLRRFCSQRYHFGMHG